MGDEVVPDHELLALSWRALQQPEADPWVRLYTETLGLAVRESEPYASIVADLARAWIPWLAAHLDTDPTQGLVDDRAAGVLASLDGLLLPHTAVGPDVAASASHGLGLPPARAHRRSSPR